MKTKKRKSTKCTTNGKLRNLRILSLCLFGYLFVIYHGSVGATGTPISIYAPGFDAATMISFQLNGTAVRTVDDRLQLTNNDGDQSGSAFWKSRIYLGTDKSFSAYFTFLIDGSDNGGADGLAFIIQTSTVDAGSTGGGIGYEGISPSIAVEFDTYDNGENGGDNHIAIVEDGCPYCEHTDYAVPSFTLDGGTVGHVWVDYDGTTGLFEVRLSETTTRPDSPLVSAYKDLATKFTDNNVFVGFTAATGGCSSNHNILDLLFENSFNSSGIDPLGSYEQAGSYAITYHVTSDGSNAVAGASVDVNGVTLTTDGSGDATISLADGIYPYTVSKTGSTSVTGTTTVSAAAKTENITLVVPPTITVSPTSLNLGYVAPGGTSGEMSYTLSGTVLTPETGNITITPPANFEVSFTSGGGFSSSAITAAYSSGILAPMTVYVLFKPTGTTTYSGNITNSGGSATTQNVNITGSSIISYCDATTNNKSYMGIQRITFNTIDNNTGTVNQGYNDFTGITTNVAKSQSYTLSIYGWGYNQFFKVWFDWNNDGDFSDVGEEYSIGGYGYNSSASISIPLGATTGNARMRVRSEYQSWLPQACGVATYGECEDYSVIVEDAAPIVWDGSESTDWNTAGNWSINAVPTGSNNVTIPNVANDPIVNQAPGTPAACNNLTIVSGAVVTVASGKALTVNGILTNNAGTSGLHIESGGSLIEKTSGVSAEVESNISSGEDVWHLFILPISESIQASTASYFNTAYLDRYDEPSGEWARLLTDDYISPDIGYSINFPTGIQSLDFVGTLKTSPVVYSNLSYTEGAPGYLAGWNLVGNPYPCAINPPMCSLSGGLNAFAYVWNGANYSTYSIGSWAFPGTISSLQGFFVRTSSATNSFTLGNVAKTHNGSDKSCAITLDMLKLNVNGNGYSDESYIRFNKNATSGFDQSFDAYKLFGLEAAPQLYSMLAEDNATVNTLPAIETNSDVAMGFKAGAENTYTITATGIESFDATTQVLLEDLKTNAIQNLRMNPVFSFTASSGDMEHRFNLHFKNSNGINQAAAGMIGIYSNQHKVYVSYPNNLQGSIYVYDLTGRLLSSTKMTGNSMDKIDMAGYSGSLIVKVITGKGITTGKVFVN